ncbi:hypothetical protein HAX54_016766 [Datura stramonium]|uniref:Uncharacterized protein n=1 Tax=Datura stramonium TaxID=4076 RepID=A0ABS8ULS6_DATST|nr:hypothetical protein [Datura stramonium]
MCEEDIMIAHDQGGPMLVDEVAKDPNPTIFSVFLEFCSRGHLGLKLEKRRVSDEEDNTMTVFLNFGSLQLRSDEEDNVKLFALHAQDLLGKMRQPHGEIVQY